MVRRGRGEVDGGPGDLPHLLHHLHLVLLHDAAGEPPADDWVRPGASSLAGEDVGGAGRERLAERGDAHVGGREDHVDGDLPGDWGGDVVVGGGAGVDTAQVPGRERSHLEAVLDHVTVGPLVGGVHQLVLPPPGDGGAGVA